MIARWIAPAAALCVSVVTASAAPPDLGLAYRAETCLSCHGAASGSVPQITGRPAAEIADALAAYRDGTRANPIMNAAAKELTDPEVSDLAAYLSAGAGRAK